jgi:hypothetical protein
VGRAVECPAKRRIELGKRPCKRRSTLKDANPEPNLLTVRDLSSILNCGRTKAWELANTRRFGPYGWAVSCEFTR